jgi:hypothetical protein
MKSILILALLALSLCSTETPVLGGWTKRLVTENSFDIDQSFKKANEEYTKTNNVDPDSLLRLTVYSQTVSGTNYKVTFIDPNADFPTIQEYIVNIPLRESGKKTEVLDHKEYEAGSGLIHYNVPLFAELEAKLYHFLKDTKEEFNYISYAFPVENAETRFFMISAYTADGQHQYIICQDKASKKYYHYQKVK